MKNTIILFILCLLTFIGCKKDETPEIYSINKLGTEFYTNEQVAMWVISNMDHDADFTWTCDSGKFIQDYTSNQAVWVAPAKKGTYTVTVTAKNGSKSVSRSAKMIVNQYYFEDWKNLATNYGSQRWAAKDVAVKLNLNNYLQMNCADGKKTGYYTLTMNSTSMELTGPVPPFSFKVDAGWQKNFWVYDSVANYKNPPIAKTHYYQFQYQFLNQPKSAGNYIKVIYLNIWPVAENNSSTPYNWQIQCKYYNKATKKDVTVDLETGTNASRKYSPEIKQAAFEMHTTGLAITQNKQVVFNLNGNEIYRSSADKLTSLGNVDNILQLDKIIFQLYANGYDIKDGPQALFTNFYMNNEEEILK